MVGSLKLRARGDNGVLCCHFPFFTSIITAEAMKTVGKYLKQDKTLDSEA